MQIAQIVSGTCAEGPGRRWAVWFQGCPLRCPGCCNPEMLSFTGGEHYTLAAMQTLLQQSIASDAVEGITLLGGEPMAHVSDALELARLARQSDLSVMIFSGHTLEELQSRGSREVDQLLAVTDILVDGPYLREQPDTQRRWIGSTNQRIHFLTERYSASDAYWKTSNTLELRLGPEGLQVNGFPSPANQQFWRKRRPAEGR